MRVVGQRMPGLPSFLSRYPSAEYSLDAVATAPYERTSRLKTTSIFNVY